MIGGKEQYEVEAICTHRYHWRKLQYLIKWKGYPESDNTWEPVNNVQAPRLVKEYHKVHPLEDKRPAERTRMTSIPTSIQPTWHIESNPQNTFANVETAAATLAATAQATTAQLSQPTLMLQPQNLYEYLASLLERSSATLPSIPHINLSSSTLARYPVSIPTFQTTSCCISSSHAPLSVTSLTPTVSNTRLFAKTLTACLTTRC
jgi:hypothetical protein